MTTDGPPPPYPHTQKGSLLGRHSLLALLPDGLSTCLWPGPPSQPSTTVKGARLTSPDHNISSYNQNTTASGACRDCKVIGDRKAINHMQLRCATFTENYVRPTTTITVCWPFYGYGNRPWPLPRISLPYPVESFRFHG